MSKSKVPKGWVKISDFEKLTGLQSKTVKLAISNGKIPLECSRKIGASPTSPTYIDPRPAATHWYNNLSAKHHNSKPTRDALEKYIKTFDRAAAIENRKQEKEAKKSSDLTMAEAQLQEQIAKAELRHLELEEKRGTLIKKELVYSQLFTFHRELRDSLLAIPDRISDEVIAVSDNRSKVHAAIYDAISETLLRLSETKERTLGE